MKAKRVVLLCLILAVLAVSGAGAQEITSWSDRLPSASDSLDIELPAPVPLYNPRSAINKATVGALNSDADLFMSPYYFDRLAMEKSFFYAGIDEWGLNLGYAGRFGGLYMGVSYGGSLIDEMFKRLTNQDVDQIFKQDQTSTLESGSAETSYNQVVDSNGTRLLGKNLNTNTLQFLLGTGGFGFKAGLSQYLNSVDLEGQKIFEFSLRPQAELGFHFNIGAVKAVAGLRGAFDVHTYNEENSYEVNYRDPRFINPVTNNNAEYPGNEITDTTLSDFNELSLGLTLGFDFSNNPAAVAELGLTADAALRFYNNLDQPGASKRFIVEYPGNADGALYMTTGVLWQDVTILEKIKSDIRISANPGFTYKAAVSDMFTVGGRLNLGVGYDLLDYTKTGADNPGAAESQAFSAVNYTSSSFRFVPELGAGINVSLLPDRFSLYTGLGIEFFSLSTTTVENDPAVADKGGKLVQKVVTNHMGLPSARFGAGFAFNFTASTAMELLAVTKNLNIDESALTLLLTIKK